jgi:myo-inositol-1(or 4)-monophosphatase
MTTHPALLTPETLAPFRRVEDMVRLSRYGGDCYAYCMVAAGHVDLVIESGLKPYDIVALVPIVEGAGGIVTNWQGGSPASGGAIVASGDKHLHEQALRILNTANGHDARP